MADSENSIPKEQESWIQKKWRPLMAIQYMLVCLSDFILFPILFTIVQFWEVQAANDAFRQWTPITLQGGGLYHMAMGAVLGITAWSRGQEKIAGAVTAPQPQSYVQQTYTQTYTQPTYQEPRQVSSFGAPQYAQVVQGYGGKPAPQQHFPEL